MPKEPKYTWNEETGVATCTIYYKNLEFTGVANCHADDEDMKNKLTGQTIAEARATICYLRHIRDNELIPQLNILNQYYYGMNRSKQFNPESYEVKMLYKKISSIKLDLQETKEEIKNIYEGIGQYIKDKDKVYQHVRDLRKQQVKDN